jgi:5'-methylthioadenosine phosphorylase
MTKQLIGIIGGSGLYEIEGLQIKEEKIVETPFGKPSDALCLGTLDGRDIAFLPRHGRGHFIAPHEINYRANIYALKLVGVERIISVSAVGSMKESIHPGDIVIVDQFIDRTKVRLQTFFSDGIVAHVSFADPVCPTLFDQLSQSARNVGAKVHRGGTYVCIEGPMFSSRAESNVYRAWGTDVIGMTNYQEAKLAREAEICYATVALSTDYDCWHETEEDVDAMKVVEVMNKNVATAKRILKDVLPQISVERKCHCAAALKNAIVTDRAKITEDVKRRLKPIIGKYVE